MLLQRSTERERLVVVVGGGGEGKDNVSGIPRASGTAVVTVSIDATAPEEVGTR